MSDTDIFLSYSREDRTAARHFAESFAQEGFTVWWDAALRSGQTFDEVIEKELRAAKAVVVLWSPRSVLSRWVRAEATLADRRNKLVPAIIEACDRPIIFELTHAADLSDWTGDLSDNRWRTLVNDLRRLVGEGDEAIAQPVDLQPVAEPKSAPIPKLAADPVAVEAKSPPLANVDYLLVAAARMREERGGSKLHKATPVEEEHTQFYKHSDDFRQHENDQIHCLFRLDGEATETRFPVGAAGVKVGRTAPADIIVAGAGVSRSHCLVELAGEVLRVSDLNSTNGTYINNKRIAGTKDLAVSSVLRVGNVSFEHEVRSRAEIEQQSPAGIDRRDPHEPRLARSS
ncbi:MAG: TIR domain-containing protein [Sphingomicrobium sp.]